MDSFMVVFGGLRWWSLALRILNLQQQPQAVDRFLNIFPTILLPVPGHIPDHTGFAVGKPVPLAVFRRLDGEGFVVSATDLIVEGG